MAKRTQHRWQAEEVEAPAEERRPSRSEKKRQADRLTQLGVQLAELNAKALAKLEMHEELRAAIMACRALRPGNARARQTRYIGKLLRQHDADTLIAALAKLTTGSREKAAIERVQNDRKGRQDPDPA